MLSVICMHKVSQNVILQKSFLFIQKLIIMIFIYSWYQWFFVSKIQPSCTDRKQAPPCSLVTCLSYIWSVIIALPSLQTSFMHTHVCVHVRLLTRLHVPMRTTHAHTHTLLIAYQLMKILHSLKLTTLPQIL